MADFTPGPWGYTGRSKTGHLDSIYIYSKNPECKRIACIGEVYFDDAEPQSLDFNARLIAAAPEIYELLKKAAPYVSICDDEMEGHGNAGEVFSEIKNLLRRIEGEEEAQ